MSKKRKLKGRRRQRPFDRAAFEQTHKREIIQFMIITEQLSRAFPDEQKRSEYIQALLIGLENEKYVEY